jgi:serine/threonine protein phosphatase PrpC
MPDGESMNIIAYGKTMTGSSGVNGDNFHISPDKQLFVLADGASGAGKYGKVVMSSTCVNVARQFDFLSSGLSPREYTDSLFQKINQALIEVSQREHVLCYGTLVIALINNDDLLVTTYGDSPAYLMKDGKIERVAQNRKRYEDMIEDGFITREQYNGYIQNMHERMWSLFDRFIPEIVPNNVIEQYPLSPGDVFITCSDGLSDWFTPEQMFEKIKQNNIDTAVDELITSARDLALSKHNHYDDITALTVIVKE